MSVRSLSVLLSGLTLLSLPWTAGGQTLSPAGARALGLAGTGTACPLGAEAIAVNPAALALPGAHRFSVTLLPLSAGWNLEPVPLSDLADFSGVEIPRATREAWMDRIVGEGSLAGAFQGSVTGLALQVGSFGFQVSSGVHGSVGLNEDAAELLLFGNAGRTGTTRDMDLEGSFVDAGALTSVGVSWALPLTRLLGGVPGRSGNGELAVGFLATYTAGHFLVLGRDMGSRLNADPLTVEVALPIVHTDPADIRAGGGVGLTLAAAWSDGPWSLGAVVHDVINTFSWNEEFLAFRPGEAILDGDETRSEFESLPFSEAPGEVRAIVDSRTPSTRVTVGGAWRASEELELFADAGRSLGRDLAGRSRTRLGGGAEFRRVPHLPLRAGVQLVSGGVRLAGGLGLEVGMVELAAGALHRTGSGRGDTTVGASLTLRGR